MDEYESLSHTKQECKYHVMFIPKCRRKRLYAELRQHLGEVFKRLAEQKESRIEEAGLGWGNFQVMRRTHASLMSDLGVEEKLVADQLGHSLDVNQNVYTQPAVSKRQTAVNKLENSLIGVQMEFTVLADSVSC
jgi:integrase